MAEIDVGWFEIEVEPGATLDRPGIYEWRIEGVGSYIGKFGSKSRPLNHYRRNVARLLDGRPYRKSKPDAFRHIHHALAAAVTAGTPVTLKILENPSATDINRRELELIALRGALNRQ